VEEEYQIAHQLSDEEIINFYDKYDTIQHDHKPTSVINDDNMYVDYVESRS